MSTPRSRYMMKAYNGSNDHTAAIDLEDIAYEDAVSSDTYDFEQDLLNEWNEQTLYEIENDLDPYDIEYDR